MFCRLTKPNHELNLNTSDYLKYAFFDIHHIVLGFTIEMQDN